MMASRGMGAINPSKMPKGVRRARRDDTDFTEYAEGGEVKSVMDLIKGKSNAGYDEDRPEDFGPRETTDEQGKPKMQPRAEYMPEGFRAMPKYVQLDKNFKAVGSRLSASKKLDKDTYLEGYVDLDSTHDKYSGHRTRGSGAGFNLIKNFGDGGEVWDKPRPKGLGKPKAMSSSKKSKAKAMAKAAGRPYPNLIDNMRAARGK